MVQESHTQVTVPVENKLTPEQEEMLWWQHYEKMYLSNEDGESEFS